MDTRQMKRMVGERKVRSRANGDPPKDRIQTAWNWEEEVETVKADTVQTNAVEGHGPCEFCKRDHDIYHCAAFFAMSPGGRRQALDKFQGCYLCLKGDIS